VYHPSGADMGIFSGSRISEVRVVAMVEHDRMNPQEGFRDRSKLEKWEAPVLEIVFA